MLLNRHLVIFLILQICQSKVLTASLNSFTQRKHPTVKVRMRADCHSRVVRIDRKRTKKDCKKLASN